jgi:hypothetical protein
MCAVGSRLPNDGFAAFWANTDPRNGGCPMGVLTKNA